MKTKRGDSVETFIVCGRHATVILNVSFNATADMMTKRGPDPSLEGFAAKHHQFTIIVIDDGSSIDLIRVGGILEIHRHQVDCTKVSNGRPSEALSLSVVIKISFSSSSSSPFYDVIIFLVDNSDSVSQMISVCANRHIVIHCMSINIDDSIKKICEDIWGMNMIGHLMINFHRCGDVCLLSSVTRCYMCDRVGMRDRVEEGKNGATTDDIPYVTFDQLCRWRERERHLVAPPRLRLCGGGEGALNTGWGSPQAATVTVTSTVTAAVTVGATVAPQVTWSGGGGAKPPAGGGAKNQLEQLNTMREALFAQDGWGCQHVNQDTQWDVPTSPEPGAVKVTDAPPTAPPVWKASVNNGTDLWEANLRNGGQPPPQPVAKTPWGHTPSTNLGGTWGEDDDSAEGGNVWTGAPAAAPAAPQWGGGASATAPGAMWPPAVAKKEAEWSGGAAAAGGGAWQDPREMRGGGAPLMDPREMRAPSADPRDMRMVDPRDMRGDPRGISGRLNGASEMWGQHHAMAAAAAAAHQMPPLNKIVSQSGGGGGGGGQWGGGGQPPKEMSGGGGKPSGWEEPSPPAQRRAVGNFDDGTSLWGQQGGGGGGGATRLPGVSHWKEGPEMRGGGAMMRPAVRMAKEAAGGGGMWRNGVWEEACDVPAGAWGGGGGGGGDSWQKGKNMWPDGGEMEWNAAKVAPPPKMSAAQVDIVRNSKQLRILHEMGFKKEDAEVALRMTNMNVDEALEVLNQQRGAVESWRRHEEHGGGGGGQFDPSFGGRGGFPGGGAGGGNQAAAMQFPPTSAAIMNNMASIQPLQVQKYLQGGHTAAPPPGNGATFAQSQPPPPTSGQPSTQQLRMLVQQIQMAVQAGYLNHQILNQPLAPQTLLLLNQLLNNIKQLQLTQSNMSSRGGVNGLQHSVAVTKLKQQISNLQNQITAQQAIYVKQQQGSHSTANDFVLRSQHDPIASLQGNFSDIALNKEQQPYQAASTQQSRLNQWKLGALEKEGETTDFSRAPGTTSKPTLSTTSSAMGSLGLQGDGTWSTGRSGTDGWPDAGVIESDAAKDWPTGQTSPSAAFTDLVPEFEPGKPWKGSQMKTIEEDPSITPGSVARSPLSITAKESDLFTGSSKTSPTEMQPISLSSSTWSFNPSSQQNFTSTAKLGGKSNSWSEHMAAPAPNNSELWGVPVSKASRGPPPGLGATKGATGASNGWVSGALSRGIGQQSWPNNWGHSTWLLLKNLTPQIDGSTLRTLCMQHGPLQNFHMYLNHSIALCKYSSREEAHKAQMALNNCVLGNTTICAESPSESEVQNILQHLAVPQGSGAPAQQPPTTPASTGGGATWRPPNQPPQQRNSAPNDTWGTGSVWTQGGGASNLWTPLESGTERGTPSNLNSFLPENLLGSELN